MKKVEEAKGGRKKSEHPKPYRKGLDFNSVGPGFVPSSPTSTLLSQKAICSSSDQLILPPKE